MDKKEEKFDNPKFSYSDIDKREDTNYLFTLQWGAEGIGFGEFVFYHKDGQLCCNTEYMGEEFIKKALCAMVDNCKLIDK